MKRRIRWIIILGTVFSILLVLSSNLIINTKTDNQIFNSTSKIPFSKVGLLLGTSKVLGSGKPNQYFLNRIKAAVELFNAKKIEYIVISGDNSREGYNEPLDMKNELIKFGVPEEKIFLDYAGFRTFDSVIRMNKIFGQQTFTIISQEFHLQRSLFIANHFGYNTVGFIAQDVDLYNGFKTKTREKLARIRVFIDFLIKKEPKFLGEQIIVE